MQDEASLRAKEIGEWFSSLATLDSHAQIIVSVSYCETLLYGVLSRYLLDHEASRELLDDARGVGSLSQMSRLARALNLVSEQRYKNLVLLRKIRNHAAHSSHKVTFSAAPVSDWLSLLSEGRTRPTSESEYQQLFRAHSLVACLDLALCEGWVRGNREFASDAAHSWRETSLKTLLETIHQRMGGPPATDAKKRE